MPLTPFVAGQIWLCSYAVRLAGTRFDARMTVIRLAGGALMLHSPGPMTPTLVAAIRALGTVAYIVAPGNFHHLHVAAAQAAFPDATTWICPGVEKRNRGLHHDGVLGDSASAPWRDEIEQLLVQGTRLMREVAMFHRASRTLVLVDLIENFSDTTPGTGAALKFWFKVVLRLWNKPGPAPEYRFGRSDRRALSASLRRILAWDFERIVLAHGDLVEQHAHAVAQAAWAGLLES